MKKVYKFIIKSISCLIPIKSLRYKFRRIFLNKGKIIYGSKEFYRVFLERNCNIEQDIETLLTKNKILFSHPIGVVVGHGVKLGNNLYIGQNVTIGRKEDDYPVIEDNVKIYANSVIVGKVVVGENSIVGAGSIVVKDIPKNEVWAGNPAKFIKKISIK